jgi:hypothetical protein
MVNVPIGRERDDKFIVGHRAPMDYFTPTNLVLARCSNSTQHGDGICPEHWKLADPKLRRALIHEQRRIHKGRVTKLWNHLVQKLCVEINARLALRFESERGDDVRSSDSVSDSGEASAEGTSTGGT